GTAISGIFPKSAVGNNLPVSVLGPGVRFAVAGLVSCVSSMVFDFCARLKVGGTHLNFFITHQLPVISVGEIEPFLKFVNPRVLELAFVEWRMEGFAEDMGDLGGPFRWDEGRRSVIRAELDALFFHLYGIERDDVDYIMETFPIVKRKDEAKYGTYRTKELILEIYDRMAEAGVSQDNPLVDGENFTSTL